MSIRSVVHVTTGLFIIAALAALVSTQPATAQVGATPSYVKLQQATPGSPQTGNVNVSGTAVANSVQAKELVAVGPNPGSPYAVYGRNNMAINRNDGGLFETLSSEGNGVSGINFANDGLNSGVFGQAMSHTGRGVYGSATAFSGNSFGVYGTSASSEGLGGYFAGVGPWAMIAQNFGNGGGLVGYSVQGVAGVEGHNSSQSWYAVAGYSEPNVGTGVGIYGRSNSASGWGVFANGRSGASGTKSFRIDHPLDPAGSYLLHYSTESPTPQNFYSGNVTTDASGKGWVELPDYFSAINTNFKYQLTVIDNNESSSFAQAKVGREIQGNRFLVMTSVPHTKVSWRIEADRSDLWVRHYGAATELKKQGRELGKYEHPELYGRPASDGIDFEAANRKAPNFAQTPRP